MKPYIYDFGNGSGRRVPFLEFFSTRHLDRWDGPGASGYKTHLESEFTQLS